MYFFSSKKSNRFKDVLNGNFIKKLRIFLELGVNNTLFVDLFLEILILKKKTF